LEEAGDRVKSVGVVETSGNKTREATFQHVGG